MRSVLRFLTSGLLLGVFLAVASAQTREDKFQTEAEHG